MHNNFPVIVDSVWLCRMCEHMAEAVAKGLDCCGIDLCGGPRQNKAFPCYKGPLSGVTYKYCYMCGDDSTMLVGRSGIDKLGVCTDCADRLFSTKD